MKRTAFAMAFATVFGIGSAQAQDYQMEFGGSLSDTSRDRPAPSDSSLGADFTYHFDRVKTAGKPLAEAAFLQSANNVAVDYETTDESKTDTVGAAVEFYAGQLYLRGGYEVEDENRVDSDTIGARVGFKLSPGLLLAAGVDRVDVDQPNTDAANNVVLEGKYVGLLGGGSAVNIEGELTLFDDPADTTTLNLGGDYYFTPTASVGLELSSSDSDAASGSTTDFGLRGRFFFTPFFSGELAYGTAGDGDDDVFSARLAFRI